MPISDKPIPEPHPCEQPTPCRHRESYANNEGECERCERNETQLYGRHAIGYGDHYEPEAQPLVKVTISKTYDENGFTPYLESYGGRLDLLNIKEYRDNDGDLEGHRVEFEFELSPNDAKRLYVMLQLLAGLDTPLHHQEQLYFEPDIKTIE